MGLIQDFLSQKPSSSIFHYTNAAATINIFQKRTIWASKISHLNDAAEHTHAAEWIEKELRSRPLSPGSVAAALKSIGGDAGPQAGLDQGVTSEQSELSFGKSIRGRTILRLLQDSKNAYVASFSEEGDLLSQWRAYCSTGNGYSLGFDTSSFTSQPGISLVKCIYDDDDKRKLVAGLVDEYDQREISSDNLWTMAQDILVLMASLKHASFREEREWRLVSFGGFYSQLFRAGRHGIVPYVELPFGAEGQLVFSDLWIGPNSYSEAALDAVKAVIAPSEGKTQHIRFKVSNTPYRQ